MKKKWQEQIFEDEPVRIYVDSDEEQVIDTKAGLHEELCARVFLAQLIQLRDKGCAFIEERNRPMDRTYFMRAL